MAIQNFQFFTRLVLYHLTLERFFEYRKAISGLAYHVIRVWKRTSMISDMEGNNGRHCICALGTESDETWVGGSFYKAGN
jgi:hypothetical protein